MREVLAVPRVHQGSHVAGVMRDGLLLHRIVCVPNLERAVRPVEGNLRFTDAEFSGDQLFILRADLSIGALVVGLLCVAVLGVGRVQILEISVNIVLGNIGDRLNPQNAVYVERASGALLLEDITGIVVPPHADLLELGLKV